MKKIISILMAAAMVLSLSACGSTQTASETENPTAGTSPQSEPETAAEPEETEPAEEADSEETADTETAGNGSNILVAYFSLAGEQYRVGVIEEGNTSIIAHMIAEETGADLFEIEPVTPYPETHSELLEVSQEEMSENARPEITGTVENMDSYDTVFIGYPNWWDTLPMPVMTFLEQLDWTGKRIIPFCTNEGSGLGQSEAAIRSVCKGAEIVKGASFRGHKVKKSEKQITEWAKKML